MFKMLLVYFLPLPNVNGCALLTTAADIYSFGILMYEVATCRAVHPHLFCDEIVLGVLHEGLRPQFPSDFPPEYVCLAKRFAWLLCL